ncbi:MAG: GTP 3',8-cyclase MoaA [Actinomycetota bacterium]
MADPIELTRKEGLFLSSEPAGIPGSAPPEEALRTPAPASGPLVDTYRRIADDLRVSVTDKCNFRCTYCMPAEGLPWLPKEQVLRFEEIVRLVGVFVRLGVKEVKLTGGEPTVRRELSKLVGMLREAHPSLALSMTTNGFLLDKQAQPLADAGLDRVTVSCDSLMRHRFAEMTRRDALDKVFEGLGAAEEAGLTPIKLNCVVIAGTNEDEVADFARYVRETGYEVRFIEYMPLDAEQKWEREKVVPSAEILETIDKAFPLIAVGGSEHEPATSFRFADGAPGAIGIIASVTEPFCETCNRLRLTADGQLRACLFAMYETDLRTPMREGASDQELEGLVRENVWQKWEGHKINHPDFQRPSRSMSMIGG